MRILKILMIIIPVSTVLALLVLPFKFERMFVITKFFHYCQYMVPLVLIVTLIILIVLISHQRPIKLMSKLKIESRRRNNNEIEIEVLKKLENLEEKLSKCIDLIQNLTNDVNKIKTILDELVRNMEKLKDLRLNINEREVSDEEGKVHKEKAYASSKTLTNENLNIDVLTEMLRKLETIRNELRRLLSIYVQEARRDKYSFSLRKS